MTGLLIEVVLFFAALAILAFMGWLLFDYRDLRAKVNTAVDEIAKEMAAMQRQIDALKQRVGL